MTADAPRVPPHNLEAERSVLGGVFIKPAVFDELRASLHVSDLFLPAHREIFDAMLAIDARKQPIDVISVADELRVRGVLERLDGAESYLLTLSNSVPTAENVAHYARLVKEKATLRRLIGACAEIQARAYGDFGDFTEFLGEAEQQVFKVATASRATSAVRLGAALPGILERIEQKALKPSEHGVPVGLSEFERRIGRLREQQVVVVAARPGGGKSAFALNTALRAAILGVPVLFFSLEMSLQEIGERSLSFASEVTNHRMVVGALNGPEWMQIQSASMQLRKVPIDFETDAERIEEIIGQLVSWRYKQFSAARYDPQNPEQKEDPPLALGVLDYIQLARGSRKDGRATEVADISRELKRAAKRLRMPLMVLSQLNREVEKGQGDAPRKPKLSDLKESGAIEQDADMVIFPFAEARTEQVGAKKTTVYDHQIIVAKHRNGPTGTIRVNFARERMTYYDMPPDEDDDPRFAL